MAYEVVLKNIPVLFAVRTEDVEIAKKLCEEIKSTVIGSQPSYCLISELSGDIDVLINATPIGMFPNVENQPVSDEVIAKCKNVFDAVYNPLETVLIQKAKANGSNAGSAVCQCLYGRLLFHTKYGTAPFMTPPKSKRYALQRLTS